MAKKKADRPNSAQQAIQRLTDGNARYVADKLQGELQDSGRRKDLAGKQEPWAIVLSCADSRVIPELIFDCGIGELFVVRVAGNIANDCSIASIEYAVANLNTRLVVVLGHENCGAVGAALGGDSHSYNLDILLGHLKQVASEYKGKRLTESVKNEACARNAEIVADRLKNQSSIIWDQDELTIVPAIYKTAKGEVEFGPWWS